MVLYHVLKFQRDLSMDLEENRTTDKQTDRQTEKLLTEPSKIDAEISFRHLTNKQTKNHCLEKARACRKLLF